MKQKLFYTISETAELAGLTRVLVYKAIESGALKVWRPWPGGNPRIHRDHLEAWMGRPVPRSADNAA